MSVAARKSVGAPRLLAACALAATVLTVSLITGPLVGTHPAPAAPTPRASAGPAGTVLAEAEQQNALLAGEDSRLLTLVSSVRSGSPPYRVTLDGVVTLVLTERGLPYGLDDLQALGAARVGPGGTVLLNDHVLVAPGAQLSVRAPGRELRLRSGADGFASLVAWKAELTLSGIEGERLAVSSWDTDVDGPDERAEDGRAYIRNVSGRMTIRHTDVAHLGFWAGRTGGVAWTGNSRTRATGEIAHSSFHDGHYGVFASRAGDLSVSGATFADNLVDGLALHRGTEDAAVHTSAARGNGRHGFSVGRGSAEVSYTDVTAGDNGRYGIFVSGTPLADGLTTGGASLRGYGDVSISRGLLRENGRAGLRIVDAHAVAVRGTHVSGNRDGIVLADTGASTSVEGTVVSGDHRFGISVQGGRATIDGNEVVGGETGIRVSDATATVVRNTVSRASRHGISVVGDADGSAVEGNTIAGRGPSGLDAYRLADDAPVQIASNDLAGWAQDRDNWTYWANFVPNHPMLLLWVLILGMPAVLGLRARRSPVAPVRVPYPDVPPRAHRPALHVQAGPPRRGEPA